MSLSRCLPCPARLTLTMLRRSGEGHPTTRIGPTRRLPAMGPAGAEAEPTAAAEAEPTAAEEEEARTAEEAVAVGEAVAAVAVEEAVAAVAEEEAVAVGEAVAE